MIYLLLKYFFYKFLQDNQSIMCHMLGHAIRFSWMHLSHNKIHVRIGHLGHLLENQENIQNLWKTCTFPTFIIISINISDNILINIDKKRFKVYKTRI